ncbi:MAG: BNR-4 repeat-containing protein, partial [Limisphaerales bacterium]
RRPLNAAPEFYALWADGNPRQPSGSHLYFTDKTGSHVWRLPKKMTADMATPEVVVFPLSH